MKLPTFSIIHAPPDTLILHSGEHPYHFARILKFAASHETVSCKALIQERVPGYNIIIALAGSLEGRIYVSAEGPHKLEQLVKQMTAWFTEKQIDNYKKYKLI